MAVLVVVSLITCLLHAPQALERKACNQFGQDESGNGKCPLPCPHCKDWARYRSGASTATTTTTINYNRHSNDGSTNVGNKKKNTRSHLMSTAEDAQHAQAPGNESSGEECCGRMVPGRPDDTFDNGPGDRGSNYHETNQNMNSSTNEPLPLGAPYMAKLPDGFSQFPRIVVNDDVHRTLAQVNSIWFSNGRNPQKTKLSLIVADKNTLVHDFNSKHHVMIYNQFVSCLYNLVIIVSTICYSLICFSRLISHNQSQLHWVSTSLPTLSFDNWITRTITNSESIYEKRKLSDWMKNVHDTIADTWSRTTHFVYPIRPIKSNLERVATFSGFHIESRFSCLKLSQYGFYFTRVGEVLQCSDCSSIVEARNIVSPPSDRKYHASARCQFAQTGEEEPGSACSIDEHSACDSTQDNTSQGGAVGFSTDPVNTTEFPTSQSEDVIDGDGPGKEPFEFCDPEFQHQAALLTDDGRQCIQKCSTLMLPKKIARDQLPSFCRQCDETLPLIESASEVIVKIYVAKRSPNRPLKCDISHGRFGTGSTLLDCDDKSEIWMSELGCNNKLTREQRNKWKNGKQISPPTNATTHCDEVFYFSIMTNKHVVLDQYEAMNVEVELFYDSEDKEGVKVANGLAVKSSDLDGDYKCYLICQTSDRNLMKRVQAARQNLIDRMDKLPQSMKELLTKMCFLIYHPHGHQKRISFGRFAVAKYGLDTSHKKKTMFYCPDKASLPGLEGTREVLLYKAPTCWGSSGSPVFTFRKTGHDKDGIDSLKLSLWVHNGLHKSTQLGGSVMRCIDRGTPDSGDPIPLEVLQSQLNTDLKPEGAFTPKNDVATGSDPPAPKKGVPPLYPEFYHWEKRLKSFKVDNYRSRCDHTPNELALGGFFFTGKDDCVRCFYCGLGLKAWRSGDNMYVEHQKSRPSCGFLKVCLEWKGSLNMHLLQDENVQPTLKMKNAPASVVVGLLTRENLMLKQQQLCKMCFRHPRRELFLPCAEVNTCEECAGILSICPSCNKKIEATATIYMS